MGSHLADSAERRVRDRADEDVGDEGTERACSLESLTRTEEETSADGAGDLCRY